MFLIELEDGIKMVQVLKKEAIMSSPVPSGIQTINVQKAREMIQKGQDVVVLDVRNYEEYHGHEGHIRGSVFLPLPVLEQRLSELTPHQNKTIVAFCYAGHRSQKACEILARNGFTKLYNVMGGMMDWYDAKYEVEPGTLPPFYV